MWRVTNTLNHMRDTGNTPNPDVTTVSRLEPAHHNYIDQLHLISRQQAAQREARKGKGEGKSQPSPPSDAGTAQYAVRVTTAAGSQAAVEVEFDGDDRVCSICLDEFEHGIPVCRLVCRHLFHIECWHNLLVTIDEIDIHCPNCRGPGRTIARFRFIASPVHAYQPPPADAPPLVHPLSRAPSTDSYQSTLSHAPTALPAWATNTEIATALHATTSLLGGRLGLIVDLGSWWNLWGKILCRQAAQTALRYGFAPQQRRLDRALQIQGVGEGTQTCEWQGTIHIAAPDEHGAASLHTFEAPIVGGSGENLPGLLRHKTICDKQGLIETAPGREMMSFPGPGGYKIEWSPGSRHFPLSLAPSGHLILPIDHYDRLPQRSGGLPQQQMTFQTTGQHEPSSSSSSGNTAPTPPAPAPAPPPPAATPVWNEAVQGPYPDRFQ